jgi:hypothetical protein
MLRKRAQTLWLWQGLCLVAFAAIPVSNWFTLQAAMTKMRFAAMDSRSTFYITSAGSFEKAEEIRAELALMAADSIFSRNPEGMDNPQRIERLFNPATATQLNADAARDADVFRTQQIHAKFESGEVRELTVDDNTALMSIEGQVLETGNFSGRVVNRTKKVKVFVRLTVNDSMATNGRYPLVVTNYEERFE